MVELNLLLGSTSDWKRANMEGQLKRVTEEHDDLTVRVEFASAHNTPGKVPRVIGHGRARPSAAGMSAALPGVVEACHTRDPKRQEGDPKAHEDYRKLTVGIPLGDSSFYGLSAFLSIAEMPPNNPVLCAGIDNVEAGIRMAYHLEKGVKGIVLAKLGPLGDNPIPDENYAKLKGKLDATLGRFEGDVLRFTEVGEILHESIPDEVKGNLVIGLYRGITPADSACVALDRILAESGGVQIVLNDGSHKGLANGALDYAKQFYGFKATGTMAVGSPGYTNAAQFAARAMGWELGLRNVLAAKRDKELALTDPEKAPTYVIKNGQTQKAE